MEPVSITATSTASVCSMHGDSSMLPRYMHTYTQVGLQTTSYFCILKYLLFFNESFSLRNNKHDFFLKFPPQVTTRPLSFLSSLSGVGVSAVPRVLSELSNKRSSVHPNLC